MGFRHASRGRWPARLALVTAASLAGLVIGIGVGCSSTNKGVDTLGAGDDASNVFIPPETGGETFDATMMHAPEASTGADAEGGAGCGEAGDAGRICGTRCVDTQNDPANCGDCSVVCANMIPGTVCVLGHCQCPGDGGVQVCSNTCVDTSSDPSNCGFCGHNCQGNACMAGLCQPNQIAPTPPAGQVVNDIAIDGTNVYWTWTATSSALPALSNLAAMPFSAGGKGTPVTGMMPYYGDLRGITTDIQNVYFVDEYNGSVGYAQLTSTTFSPRYVVPAIDGGMSASQPWDIAVDGQNMYWVDNGDGTVNQAALPQGSGAAGPIKVLATQQAHPIAIAVDAQYVYWINHGTTQTGTGSVNRIAIGATCGNGCVLTLAASQNQPEDIAIDSTSVYWTSGSNSGSVSKVSTTGTQLTVLVQNLGAPSGIAVDTAMTLSDPNAERFVYWTNFNDNTVSKLSLTGTSKTPYPLASQPAMTPSAIAIDTKNVYWVNRANGTLWKVAK
ncbi:MAG TPA: hypothetical protein VKU41_01100 [Polyangiaceae bacterium]|nr:hypothetical protein [Polyangiaceae bacterium]